MESENDNELSLLHLTILRNGQWIEVHRLSMSTFCAMWMSRLQRHHWL